MWRGEEQGQMPKVRVDPGCAGGPPGQEHVASGERGQVEAGALVGRVMRAGS